jgi:hypothetical protein
MPNRKNYLLTILFSGTQASKLFPGPVLGEKGRTENNGAELTMCEPIINLLTQAIAYGQLVLIKPNSCACTS